LAGPKILVLGDVTVDVIVKPEGPLVHGSDCWSDIHIMPGGSGANQAVWLASLGVDVRFAGKVGGADVVTYTDMLRKAGVEPYLAGDDHRHTSTVVAIIDPKGERSFYTDRGANETLSFEDLPLSLLDGVSHVQISGYSLFSPAPRSACLVLFAEAQNRGLTTSIDPASTALLAEIGPERFLGWSREASLIFPNRGEAELLTGEASLIGQIRKLSAIYKRAVVKLGADGAAVGSKDGISLQLDAPSSAVVDTTGAGDAFLAGYLAAFVRGLDEHACLKQAIELGAKAVARFGAQPDQDMSGLSL
jgi:sugar/nucleoside kinase (ribokinase family)